MLSKTQEILDMKYDVIIVGAGPGGIFSAYELKKNNADINVAVIESGNPHSKTK